MSDPVVLNLVRPGRGWSAGRTLVQLDGGGFRMPPPANRAASSPVPVHAPTVRVLFDGKPATDVQVISPTIIRCTTPPHPPDRVVNKVLTHRGTVDVVVQNLDDAGAPISGEVATATDGFQFVRPELGPKQVRGAWLRVIDAWLDHLRNVALENVCFSPSVDMDVDTGDVRGFLEMAELPGIAVTRVSFPDSSTSDDELHELEADEESILLRRKPVTTDLLFTLVLVSNSLGELLNLSEVTRSIFVEAASFPVQVDPTDAAHGVADFQMVISSPLTISDRMGATNIVTAEVSGCIYRLTSLDVPGAPTEGLPGIPRWIPHQGTRALVRHAETISVARSAKARDDE